MIFLVASSLKFLSMMSPMCSRLMAKEMISIARLPFALVEAAARELGDVELDRLVEPIDGVVHLRHLIDQRPVVGHHRRHHLAQHGFDEIAHAQGFARGVGKRKRRSFKRAFVEIARPRRIGFLDAGRQQLFQNPSHDVEQADEDDRGRDIEGDVKFRRQLREVGLPGLQMLGDGAQERRDQEDADQPVEQIAERKAVARGVVAPRALEHRVDGAAEIGAKHQRQRGDGRNEMRVGQRHDQEDAGDARMHEPGYERRR